MAITVNLHSLQGKKVDLSTSTPCTDRFQSNTDWEEYVRAVEKAEDFESDPEKCTNSVCSPSAADRGQCSPGRYIIRFVWQMTSCSP
jgi:phytoene dehydrogenase-like protein